MASFSGIWIKIAADKSDNFHKKGVLNARNSLKIK